MSNDKSRTALMAELANPRHFDENIAEMTLDEVGSIRETVFDRLSDDDIVSLGIREYIDLEEQTEIKNYMQSNDDVRYLRPGDIYNLCDKGRISADLRDRLLFLFDEYPVEGENESSVDLHDLDSDQVMSLLEEMVQRGEITGEEARLVYDEVEDARGGGNRGSPEDNNVEMTGKFPNAGGQSADPEVEKLDEMLDRFRD
jgi:polyhydroxyalkanoate synthesis regulator phasin